MSAKLTSQRRISPHEGQEGGSIGSASAAASFGWRNGCASPGEGVDSCRQRSQIGNPGLNVVGHSRYGLPYGQDRLIPIWVATLAVLHQSRTIHFNSAAEVLRTFDLPLDGKAIAGSWTAHSDAARIRLATGLHLDSFSKPASAGRALRDMRQGSSRCFFYEGGRCRIYESRPKVATSHPTSSLPMRLWLAYRRRRFPISTTPSSANSRP